MKTSTRSAVLGLIGSGLLVACLAQAGEEGGNDALAAAAVPISLPQAVTTALQQVPGGVAVAVDLAEEGPPAWEVEVVKGAEVLDILVDASTGKVLANRPDQPDDSGTTDEESDEHGGEAGAAKAHH